MDYADDDLEQGSESAPNSDDSSSLRIKLEKLEKDNFKLRSKVRRVEWEQKYGAEALEGIDESLPLQEQLQAIADKLAEQRRGTATTQDVQAAEADSQGEPDPEEAKLAAVASASPTAGSQVPPDLPTLAEVKELHKTDPVRAAQIINSGEFQKQENW